MAVDTRALKRAKDTENQCGFESSIMKTAFKRVSEYTHTLLNRFSLVFSEYSLQVAMIAK